VPRHDPPGIPDDSGGPAPANPRFRTARAPNGAGFAGLAVLPIFLAGLAEAYVYYVLPQLHWVSLAWRARGVPVYLSFAFWEWITCALLSVYMAVLSVAVQERGQARKAVR
jgi:hypothetical protein